MRILPILKHTNFNNEETKMNLVYFDNAATTKTDEKVVEAMMPYLTEKFGNPSSQHFVGQEAKQAIEEARKIIAKSINAKTSEIVFTS